MLARNVSAPDAGLQGVDQVPEPVDFPPLDYLDWLELTERLVRCFEPRRDLLRLEQLREPGLETLGFPNPPEPGFVRLPAPPSQLAIARLENPVSREKTLRLSPRFFRTSATRSPGSAYLRRAQGAFRGAGGEGLFAVFVPKVHASFATIIP